METAEAQLCFAFEETSSGNGDGEILVWLSNLLMDLRIKGSVVENNPYYFAWWRAGHCLVGTRLEPYDKADLLRPLEAVGTNDLNHDFPSQVDLCVWCGRSDESPLSTDNREEQDQVEESGEPLHRDGDKLSGETYGASNCYMTMSLTCITSTLAWVEGWTRSRRDQSGTVGLI